jgi:hypothetical protein
MTIEQNFNVVKMKNKTKWHAHQNRITILNGSTNKNLIISFHGFEHLDRNCTIKHKTFRGKKKIPRISIF